MNGINSISGLNNVPVDYRPAPNAAAPGAQPPAEPEAPNAPRASSVVRQLDVLLLGAAGRSIGADAAVRAKTIGETLVKKGVVTAEESAKLQSLAKKAADTLKALDKFSGAELAKALMPDKNDRLVWRKGFFFLTSTAKAVKAAVEAQQALSEGLEKFNRRLATSDAVGIPLKEAFVEMQFQADRRSSEIYSVVLRMHDMALQDAAAGAGGDPQVKSLLSATFDELVPREAILMHGTAEALQRMNEQMRPLAEKLEAFQTDGGKLLSSEQIATLERDMQIVKAAILNVRKNGLEVPGGRIEVDKSLLDGMMRTIDSAAKKIADARAEMAERARAEFIKEVVLSLTPGTSPEERALADDLAVRNQVFAEFMNARAELVRTLSKIVSGEIPRSKIDVCINAANLRIFNAGISKEFLTDLGFSEATAKAVSDHIDSIRLVKVHFKQMLAKTDAFAAGEAGGAIAGFDVRRIFLGDCSLSSAVDANIRGFKPEDVDPATDDANVASSRLLGGGQAGSVYLVTMKNGAEYVFKPELEGRLGLDHLVLAQGGAFADAQTTAQLNLATQDTAKALGCADVVVKYSVGNHDGRFGIFMEKAKGATGEQFSDKADAGDANSIKPSELKTKLRDGAENAIIRGNVARKLCQLEWLDIITGQMDRHWNNYFVNIDKSTHEVSVKAIDCDASFTKTRIGLQKYSLDGNYAKKFFGKLLEVCNDLHTPDNGQKEYDERVKKDPAIVYNANGSITVDLTKAKSPEVAMALLKVFGMQTFAVPEVIDESTYERLMELDANEAKKQAFLDSLSTRISPDALAATGKRLDEAIAHAKKLKEEGMVYSADDWKQPLKLGQLTKIKPSVEITCHDGQKLYKRGKDNTNVSEYLIRMCPSFFCRDFLNITLPK